MYDAKDLFDGWEPSLSEDSDEINAILVEELGEA